MRVLRKDRSRPTSVALQNCDSRGLSGSILSGQAAHSILRSYQGVHHAHVYVLMLVYGRHFMPSSEPPLHAGCVEALSTDRALLLAFWTVHRPPSATALALALRLLHALAASPPAAWAAAAQGGAVYLMTSLLPVTPAPAHEAVGACSWSLHLASCANA